MTEDKTAIHRVWRARVHTFRIPKLSPSRYRVPEGRFDPIVVVVY